MILNTEVYFFYLKNEKLTKTVFYAVCLRMSDYASHVKLYALCKWYSNVASVGLYVMSYVYVVRCTVCVRFRLI